MESEVTPVMKESVKLAREISTYIGDVSLYENSVHENGDDVFFMVREGLKKFLIVYGKKGNNYSEIFSGEELNTLSKSVLKCPLSHENAKQVREQFTFTRAVLIGKDNSYGFGDRLGNAGPAHLRAVRKTGFKPILAQQSIRELERTKRTAEEVMDAATWSVFQEGYHGGFGSDGDHLKTPDDIDRMVRAGYTMFTIDPSDYVRDDVKSLSLQDLEEEYCKLPWSELDEDADVLMKRLLDLELELRDGFLLSPGKEEILQGMVKYGRVVVHTKVMSDYIDETYPDHPTELELSVDETDDPTTLFEHYLVASELNRLGVRLVSLAPRFCGHFEKGIDFKGDLEQFQDEYVQHLAIAGKFGGYKLSVHSGSDKFSVYKVIGSLDLGTVHVKTAGTSYLEALRTVAEADPDFFREILKFSLKRFESDKKTYHISADQDRIPDPDSLDNDELADLLDDNDTRQVLHVAYGSVLSGNLSESRGFKKRLMELLEENEELHEANLVRLFEKHLNPFI